MYQRNYIPCLISRNVSNRFGGLMAFRFHNAASLENPITLPLGSGRSPSIGSDEVLHDWHWTAAIFASFSPPTSREAAPEPDPEDDLDVEPDPDPEEENEADIIPSSITTRAVAEGGTRGGDGTINPPFP